jgi:micrococcal nuclease
VAAVLLAGCARSPMSVASPTEPIDRARVSTIVDGDTIDADIGGETERVRLIGIDTPESVSRTTPHQCYGTEATDALRGLIPPGTELLVERDTEARDRYGRLLLYLWRVDDGLFVNEWMVANGFANAATYAPNDHRASVFVAAEAAARAKVIGLWLNCDGPDQPVD